MDGRATGERWREGNFLKGISYITETKLFYQGEKKREKGIKGGGGMTKDEETFRYVKTSWDAMAILFQWERQERNVESQYGRMGW